MRRYLPITIHRYLDLRSTQRIQTHTDITPLLLTLVQAPYTLPTYTTHTTATKTHTRPTLHLHLSPQSSQARHLYYTKDLNHVYHPYTHSPQPHLPRIPHHHCRHHRTLTLSQATHMQHKQQYIHHSHRNNRTHNIGYYDNLTDRPMTTSTTQAHIPSSKSEKNLILLQVNINGLKNKLEELKLLIHDTHTDIIIIQETKLTPKLKHPKYMTSQQCATIGCTRQAVGLLSTHTSMLVWKCPSIL